jgi:LacI family gluconate utilization system Gnt-I transcriptional repressor
MAHYLIGRGYRRIAYIGHDISTDFRAHARLEGFKDGLAEVGLTLAHALVLDGPSSVPLGRTGLAQLLGTASPPPEAVFFSNDDMAVGGVFHCQTAGLSLPGDIALAGFNGLSIGQALPTPLTTIASNREHIGFVAADHILRALTGDSPPRVTRIDFRLVPGSTA